MRAGMELISGVTGVSLLMGAADFPAFLPMCVFLLSKTKKAYQGLFFGTICYICIKFYTFGVIEVLLQSWFTRG